MLQYEFLSAWLQAKTNGERGANLVEYALLVGLIAVICVAAISLIGRQVATNFSEASSGVRG